MYNPMSNPVSNNVSNNQGGLSSYGLLLLLVTYFQTKEYENQNQNNYQFIQNEFPILGILLVDFFNFYISMELLAVQIRPFLPNDFVKQLPYEPRQMNVNFIQVQGKGDKRRFGWESWIFLCVDWGLGWADVFW